MDLFWVRYGSFFPLIVLSTQTVHSSGEMGGGMHRFSLAKNVMMLYGFLNAGHF